MSDEKPLHIRVAEALGTYHVLGKNEGTLDDPIRHCTICGTGPYDYRSDHDGRVLAPRYDTDWAAGGPLIEEYKLGVWHDGARWRCSNPGKSGRITEGATVLEAVCRNLCP